MIELDRVGWENGTLVSPAKVNVQGTVYDVEPEIYSGNTPLSAELLKEMEDNTEKAINESVDEATILSNTYSTTEKVVGKWIDNKPIYRKVVNIGNLPNNTTQTYAHGVSNFERPIKMHTTWYDTDDARWYSALRRGASTDATIVQVTCDTSNIIIQAEGVNWSNRTRDCVVILEYTKTTD